MAVLVDADVLIDISRNTPSAVAWLARVGDDAFEVPSIVVMELLAGCRDGRALRTTRKFLARFAVIYPTAGESRRAIELLADHRLASGLGIGDAIIAAMALEREARLLSFNLRHFGAVPDLDVQAPYDRS